jgi:hypothetical protein
MESVIVVDAGVTPTPNEPAADRPGMAHHCVYLYFLENFSRRWFFSARKDCLMRPPRHDIGA